MLAQEASDRVRIAVPERGDRRAEMGLRRVAEVRDEGMPRERGVDVAPLHPDAPAVHDADLAQSRVPRGAHILRDHRADVARREGVQIDLRLDGRPVWRFMAAHTSP